VHECKDGSLYVIREHPDGRLEEIVERPNGDVWKKNETVSEERGYKA
jgi:hypothetical protein